MRDQPKIDNTAKIEAPKQQIALGKGVLDSVKSESSEDDDLLP